MNFNIQGNIQGERLLSSGNRIDYLKRKQILNHSAAEFLCKHFHFLESSWRRPYPYHRVNTAHSHFHRNMEEKLSWTMLERGCAIYLNSIYLYCLNLFCRPVASAFWNTTILFDSLNILESPFKIYLTKTLVLELILIMPRNHESWWYHQEPSLQL